MYNHIYDYDYDFDFDPFTNNLIGPTSNDYYNQVGAFILTFLAGIAFIIFLLFILSIVVYIAKWKLFKKAGKKAWESLIPIHSDIIEFELGGIETYWYFLNYVSLIPFLGWAIGWIPIIVLHLWKCINLAKSFGKSTGFGVLMAFIPYIGYPVLAFGSSQYIGPQTNTNNQGYTSHTPNNQGYMNYTQNTQSYTNSTSNDQNYTNATSNSQGYSDYTTNNQTNYTSTSNYTQPNNTNNTVQSTPTNTNVSGYTSTSDPTQNKTTTSNTNQEVPMANNSFDQEAHVANNSNQETTVPNNDTTSNTDE